MAADQDDIRADVLTLLQNFRGVEPMKELFWSHLNYERVSMPSRSVSILRLSMVRLSTPVSSRTGHHPYRAHNTPDPATPGP
jgi:hypothetical protein